MDEATIRKWCEQVFRDATGHPSFIGRDGADLRDVFASLIYAAYADGLAASGRDDGQKSAQQFNGTYEALHQRVAEAQRTTDQLRAEYRRIECINHDLEQQVARLERERDDYK